MVFIENDVSATAMDNQSSKSKCVFFCNQTEILGVGIGAGVFLIAMILSVTCCFYMKKKPSSGNDTSDDEIEVGVSRVAVV